MHINHLAALLLATPVLCIVHEIIVGTFGTPALYTLGFDDETERLTLLRNTTTDVASSWIALSHDKKALYGTQFGSSPGGSPSFVSYSIVDGTTLVPNNKTLSLGGECANSTANAIFVVADERPPYAVYGVPFGSNANCGAVMSVDDTGALDEVIQNYTYGSESAVHGMAIGSDGSYLFSADDSGNQLWTHKINRPSGNLTLMASVYGPESGSNPRHVATHPAGEYLYAVLEESNEIGQYWIEVTGQLRWQNVSFGLIPSTVNGSQYWSDEVALSKSSNFLWATSRSRSTSSTGYISAFNLTANGTIDQQLFLLPTTSSGGSANAVAPSGFNDEYVALTDSSVGFVEIWKLAANASAATVVSHLDLNDGGCCANAVWYS
ncbi:Carboxy-cis,cis-muconate cyclase [Cercospora beticola]|uniref:Carboxy-cis,cis-muconate cyclase n=1 Tax=Cercospora beticola TaxID=122368 RepID=A0A2G5H8Z1_CERBT|nr:Carboxy-cis,cis-muconate cyclase [Cercospora beticola]PIA88996.1 Carboxy-cis,cis-muconate cyclase [Cercospora beticola]WPB02604.1 hypothetical protein RHO25_007240 [Cercospora beticola]